MYTTTINILEFQIFDVNSRTGFMPFQPPISRLPAHWELWESLLDDARREQLQPADKLGITAEEMARSERWRSRVSQTPLLSINDMATSTVLLRRAHLVLTFLMHFYIHTIPPDSPVLIPRPISIPILQVAKVLDLPPVITFSDTVLYNWRWANNANESDSSLESQTLFTGLQDEEVFYLCSARIELRGVDALNIMCSVMDEIFCGDEITLGRLTTYLLELSTVIDALKSLLLDVRKGCDPEVYYNAVRPWFRGEDSDSYVPSEERRKWVFEGAEEYPDLNMLPPDRELSGASAGQSSLIHALDVFLGVDHDRPNSISYMKRMQRYMPHPHRCFLSHLAKNPRPLRDFVMTACSEDTPANSAMKEAYNKAVSSLKEFRDSHMVIAGLYIIGPARRAAEALVHDTSVSSSASLKDRAITGTGGTDLLSFLKGVKKQTVLTLIT